MIHSSEAKKLTSQKVQEKTNKDFRSLINDCNVSILNAADSGKSFIRISTYDCTCDAIKLVIDILKKEGYQVNGCPNGSEISICW